MTRPQQSTIVKSSAPQYCNSPRTSGSREENLQSTKSVKSEAGVEENSNFYPDSALVKTHELCATVITFNIKKKGFSDITGAFPHKSSRGNLYIMVMYDYDSNAILAKPIKKCRQKLSAMRSTRSTRSSNQELANLKFTLCTTSVLVT